MARYYVHSNESIVSIKDEEFSDCLRLSRNTLLEGVRYFNIKFIIGLLKYVVNDT